MKSGMIFLLNPEIMMLNHKLNLLLQQFGIDDPFSDEKLYMVVDSRFFWRKGTYFDCLDFVCRCQSGLSDPLRILPYDDSWCR